MQRIVEPELMATKEQAIAYNLASPRKYAVKEILSMYKKYCNVTTGKVIDLGCGTADYLVELNKEFKDLNVMGYDASEQMIEVAKDNIQGTDVTVVCLPMDKVNNNADCVISTNTLHHIHEPKLFWEAIARTSNKVFVLDLVRPQSILIAKNIVETMAGNETRVFKNDFFNSLLAAFTKQELEEQVKHLGLTVSIEGNDDFLQVAIIHGEINESI